MYYIIISASKKISVHFREKIATELENFRPLEKELWAGKKDGGGGGGGGGGSKIYSCLANSPPLL